MQDTSNNPVSINAEVYQFVKVQSLRPQESEEYSLKHTFLHFYLNLIN
jgi:hypothetical protein